jgi:hypothetical protein
MVTVSESLTSDKTGSLKTLGVTVSVRTKNPKRAGNYNLQGAGAMSKIGVEWGGRGVEWGGRGGVLRGGVLRDGGVLRGGVLRGGVLR